MNSFRKLRIMQTLSKDVCNKTPIYSFDVETHQTDETSKRGLNYKKQDFLFGIVYGDDLNRTFWNREDMQKFMISSRKLRNSMIFATNLDFDFRILYNNSKYYRDFFKLEKNSLIFAKYKKGRNSYKFYDTLNYTKAGVEKLGSMLDIGKLPYPKSFKRKPRNNKEKVEFEKYCLRDCIITHSFAKYIRDYCNDINAKFKTTIASIGLDCWRRNYQEFDIFQERKNWIKKHYEGSLRGGRTEAIKRGFFNDVYVYDFNSHYPAVCHDGIDGKGNYPNPNSARYIKDSCMHYVNEYEGISKVKIKCPYMYYPFLAIRCNNKLMFPYGKMSGWFTHIEIRKAVELGYKVIDVMESIFYDKYFIPFRKYIDNMYNKRIEFSDENNLIMRQLCKDQMNGGTFGKFAQKIDEVTKIHSVNDLYAENSGEVYIMIKGQKHILKDYIIRGEDVYEKMKADNYKIPVFINPILSSYTTALARIKLFDYSMKYIDELAYDDTDSIFLLKKCFNSSKELGELSLEYKADEMIIVRPKCYYRKIDGVSFSKVKGLKKRLHSKKDFINLIMGVPVFYERFSKNKESSVRDIPYASILLQSKIISSEDDKRKWFDKFSYKEAQNSEPLQMIKNEIVR